MAAAAVAAWPVTVVALAGYLAAWLRGWPPARLWHAACWSLPMTAVYAIGQGLRLRSWPAVALAPVNDWAGAWRLLAAHAVLRAGLLVAPVAVPAGLAIGGLWWAWRIYAVTTGLAGQTASAPVWFDERQWRHQVRSARGRAAAPGTVPLLTGRGRSRSARPSAPSATGGGPSWPSRRLLDPAFGDHRLVRQREDEPDDAAVGRLVRRHPRCVHPRGGGPAAADRPGLQRRPGRAH